MNTFTILMSILGIFGTLLAPFLPEWWRSRKGGGGRDTPASGEARAAPAGAGTYQPSRPFASPATSAVAVRRGISKSLAFGMVGLLLWKLPLPGCCVILPGLWIGIRDIRAAAGRVVLWAKPGAVLCALAFVAFMAHSILTGATSPARQDGNSSGTTSQPATVCSTWVETCPLIVSMPVSESCYCETDVGPVYGTSH
jgi:hypothetical protein